VNVGTLPAEDELTVAGFIGRLKVAVTEVPVTTLSLAFVLVGTFVAPLPGIDEITVGSVRVPAGATAAEDLPVPPAARNAANNSAMNIGLTERSNLII
jgi:hypothetical protein